jgi:hypothetical protein
MNKIIHLLHCPWTGLGLYDGFRGNRWLKNRIRIFKQFVIPSLQNQTSKNFVLWCAFRHEEKSNSLVKELMDYMSKIPQFKTIFTFNGICFYDDKYPPEQARNRLLMALHGSIGNLIDTIGDVDYVLMTIQPSDDCYHTEMVEEVQKEIEDCDAVGYSSGYIINYQTKEVKEYNPKTNPPFYTIKFPKAVFIDPTRHAYFTSIKKDVGKYKAGTPIPSHEYVVDAFGDRYKVLDKRGFIVGCHGENISTNFNIPYAGEDVDSYILYKFGLLDTPKLKISFSIGKRIMKMLPHRARRKLRYWRELLHKL